MKDEELFAGNLPAEASAKAGTGRRKGKKWLSVISLLIIISFEVQAQDTAIIPKKDSLSVKQSLPGFNSSKWQNTKTNNPFYPLDSSVKKMQFPILPYPDYSNYPLTPQQLDALQAEKKREEQRSWLPKRKTRPKPARPGF